MSERMSPEGAQAWLDAYTSTDLDKRMEAWVQSHEMMLDMARFIAAMVPEYDHEILGLRESGGEYVIRRHTRHVTDWTAS